MSPFSMSIPAVLPEPSSAFMDVDEALRHGIKRPRAEEDESSVSSLQAMSDSYVRQNLTLVAPLPKRPRSSPSNQIQYDFYSDLSNLSC